MLRVVLSRTLLALTCLLPVAAWSVNAPTALTSPAASAASAKASPAPEAPASAAMAVTPVSAASVPAGGRTVLRVAVKPAKPFAFQEGGQWRGYSVELWNAIAQKNNWQFEWVPVETVPLTLEGLQKGEFDVGVGALSVTPEREQVLDFSHPFFESGLQIVTGAATTGSIWVALQGLMSAPVLSGLAGLVAALFVVSWLLWRFERKRNAESFPEPMGQGLKESLWWSTNILIAGGCENISPSGTPGRLVAVVWMLGGIAFTSYITAVFTSTLTVTRLNSDVQSISDLQSQIVGTVEGSSSDAFLTKQGIPQEGHDTIESAMSALVAGEVKAVVYDAPLLRYWMTTHAKESAKLVAAGDTFARQHYGYALPVGSAKRKPINEALLELRSAGFLEELDKRWFGASNPSGS